MKLGKVNHIGIVVNDLDAATKEYSAKYGIKRWYELQTEPFESFEYLGKPANCKVRLYYGGKGATKLELIGTEGDPNSYTHYLQTRGEGIHHLQYYVKDLDAAVAEAKADGMQIIQSAHLKSGALDIRYVYIGESPDNVLFELIEAKMFGKITKGDMPCEVALGLLTGNYKRVK